MASIFDTLLSSQESDTHHQPTISASFRGNPSNLPASSLGVKPANRPSGRPSRTRLVSAAMLSEAYRINRSASAAPDARSSRAPQRGDPERDRTNRTGLDHDGQPRDRPTSLTMTRSRWRPFLPVGLTKRTLTRPSGETQIRPQGIGRHHKKRRIPLSCNEIRPFALMRRPALRRFQARLRPVAPQPGCAGPA